MLKINHLKCVGCGACSLICPTKAIKMEQNSRGFVYPTINKQQCIGCNMCDKVCLCNEKYNRIKKESTLRYYVAKHSDAKLHYKSQSGGISYAIGERVIGNSGIVYGCVYDEKCVAVHRRASTKDELKKTRGSKYVQSNLENTYEKVYKDLKNKTVLFTGTPCQVEGLYRFLKQKNSPTTNLYTVDLICHGVPSPLVLKDFLDYIKSKNNSNVKEVNLRNKKFSPDVITTITLENGKTIKSGEYSELFYTNICLRESCGNCEFTTVRRNSDITIGDVTGLDAKYKKYIDYTNPPSILIIRTNKGLDLVNDCKIDKMEIATNEFDQPNLHKSSIISPQKEKFWREYKKKGFEYIIKKYTSRGGLRTKMKRKIMQRMGRW